MAKSVTVGLVSGLTLVVLTLLAVGVLNLPAAESAPADEARQPCAMVQVAQDQGYGVAKTVSRRVCAETPAPHH